MSFQLCPDVEYLRSFLVSFYKEEVSTEVTGFMMNKLTRRKGLPIFSIIHQFSLLHNLCEDDEKFIFLAHCRDEKDAKRGNRQEQQDEGREMETMNGNQSCEKYEQRQ